MPTWILVFIIVVRDVSLFGFVGVWTRNVDMCRWYFRVLILPISYQSRNDLMKLILQVHLAVQAAARRQDATLKHVIISEKRNKAADYYTYD